MNKLIFLLICFINIPFLIVNATENAYVKEESKSYSLYLIRHAEKKLIKRMLD
ncbi:hypothetical protein [Colwellia sp. PAMC 20917]|uniref:hypothetical protein n=1 Tax=Colwellia sp. PAMC 20917 TaxID=1816218 RepID=UPI0012FC2F31|nr:hypothetical protein [Colwellia sp. PAMC 20917]